MSELSKWRGILDDGEEIIWQGHPEPKIRFEFKSPFEPFFYMFFTGFSVFWMVMASQAPGPFWMFGLLFFGVGSFNLIGKPFWRAWERRNCFYTLTNKRAFIATKSFFGSRKLDSYPLTSEKPLQFVDGDLSSIYFDTVEHRTQNVTVSEQIGFELLKNGRDVFRKMRDMQQATRET
ncbi:aspartate carbamoyltransferase catalytic subunit [uncultured Litoreibacter sp.]|uniref:aspartate carbamoyltransferase catalytic subunit n=1 Tax=uncultured Litoreibacter sp. TaxID=1392394 RepID=UPI0026218F25|nr:aspartate carbamoyltransferase catalytic subunit [uncultured Litoreibacter sp.]